METPSEIVQKEGTPPDDVPKEKLEEPKEETTIMTISPENVQTEGAFQFNFFADLLHGIHPGYNGDDRRRYWREDPNDNDMNSMMEFEKWNELNEDCRMAVVKYLNYYDRCKLGICSKRDYDTVKFTPLDVHSIYIRNDSLIEYDNVTVTVNFYNDYRPGNKIQLIFSQLGEDTQVRWYEDYQKERDYHRWLEEKHAQVNSGYYRWAETFSDSDKERLENKMLVLKSCNYNEEAVKFAEKWMKKCNFELKYIFIKIKNYPVDKSQIKSLPKCKSIYFGADDVETFRWWIHKLPKQMENIQLVQLDNEQEVFTIPSDLLNAPQIMETSEFEFWCRADFSDEQFLNLKANTFDFQCVNITDQGINKATLSETEDRNFEEMTRGISYREWHGDFARDAPYGFCRSFYDLYEPVRCVQIYSNVDPYESLTLGVASDCVLIYKTGHKMEDNGRTYSAYYIPW